MMFNALISNRETTSSFEKVVYEGLLKGLSKTTFE